MGTIGNSSTPTYGWDQYFSGANQAAQLYTMPAGGGYIQSVSFYAAADGSSHGTFYGCVWDSSGNLLGSGGGVSTTGGHTIAGGQAWYTDNFPTQIFVAGGAQIYIGWQGPTSVNRDWSWAGDGATVAYHTAGASPSNFGSSTTVQNGSIGAYATYNAGAATVSPYAYNTSWLSGATAYAYNTSWVGITVYAYNGSSWVQVG